MSLYIKDDLSNLPGSLKSDNFKVLLVIIDHFSKFL